MCFSLKVKNKQSLVQQSKKFINIKKGKKLKYCSPNFKLVQLTRSVSPLEMEFGRQRAEKQGHQVLHFFARSLWINSEL